jgi:hypothetical protein
VLGGFAISMVGLAVCSSLLVVGLVVELVVQSLGVDGVHLSDP